MENTIDTGDPHSCTWLLGVVGQSVYSTDVISVSWVFYLIITSVLLLLLFLSAVISGAEVAFFSLSTEDRNHCREGNPTERQIVSLLDNPKSLLATVLIGNNLANISFITLSTYLAWVSTGSANARAIVLTALTAVVAFLLVFFGELIPKVYASQKSFTFAKWTVRFISLLSKAFKPFAWLLINLTQLIENRVQRKGYSVSVEGLNHALEMSNDQHTTAEEKEILKGIVNFGTISARQIMRSRVDITAFDVALDFHELMDKINKFGYSRVPVFRETIDKIEGILYIKDLLPFLDQDEYFEWKKLLHPGYFIPENKKIDDLLYDFQEKRVHMAIVVDEYGGTSGLITLEDIMEEIVGEINDEFDEDNLPYSQLDEHTYLFEGKISLNDFCKVLEIDSSLFEDVKGDSESLGGLLLELFSKLPRSGQQISYHDFTFSIVSVDAKKIKKVKVHVGQSENSTT